MVLSTEMQITADEYQQLPEGPPYYQLIGGKLFMTPSPTSYHQKILGNLHLVLAPFVNEGELGEVYLAPLDVRLSENDVYQPDLIFVRRERLQIIGENGLEGAPDLAVEILSPSTLGIDRDLKRKAYAQFGVVELWLIDPIEKQISLYDLQKNPAEPYEIFESGDSLNSRLFPGLALDTAQIF